MSTESNANLAALSAYIVSVEQVRDSALSANTDLAARVVTLEGVNSGQAAEIARLQAIIDGGGTTVPPSKVPPLRFGACVAAGQTASGTVTKFGPKTSVRWFSSGGMTNVAPRPAGAARVHASWKPLGTTLTDTSVTAAVANLLPGDKVTVEHEADVKYVADVKAGNPNALAALHARLALIEQFHDIVKRIRPDLTTVHIVGGWRFHPKGDNGIDPMFLARSDVLGVDLDGANPVSTTQAYLDWTLALPNIVATANANYGGRWTCPEFGWGPMSSDPNRSKRMAAVAAQMPAIVAAGPEEVEWYDYALAVLSSGAETAAWASLVASTV